MLQYACKYCANSNNSQSTLLHSGCSKSPTGYHVPILNHVGAYCECCGAKTNYDIPSLTSVGCSRSPTGNHIAAN